MSPHKQPEEESLTKDMFECWRLRKTGCSLVSADCNECELIKHPYYTGKPVEIRDVIRNIMLEEIDDLDNYPDDPLDWEPDSELEAIHSIWGTFKRELERVQKKIEVQRQLYLQKVSEKGA